MTTSVAGQVDDDAPLFLSVMTVPGPTQIPEPI